MADKMTTVLPCRIGDTVWAVRRFNGGFQSIKGVVSAMQYINSDMVLSISVQNTCRGEWGKVVFASKEDAEAEIERRKSGVRRTV